MKVIKVIKLINCVATYVSQTSVETGSGHPGHIFSGLDHVRNEIVRLTTWKLINAIA